MHIGLSYDLKEAIMIEHDHYDDAQEEYDSSITIELIAAVIEAKGHRVIKLGGGSEFLDNIRRQRVDFVFNIAEGRGNLLSREAQIPAILEMLGIPYTGSDPQCLAICLDKPVTKKIVAADNIPTPKWLVFEREQSISDASWHGFPFPAIIKPTHEGSSKGIRFTSLVHDISQAQNEVGKILQRYQQPVMVEEFIDGDEVTVGIIGNVSPEILGVMRVKPKIKQEHFIYSLEVKRDYQKLVEYECPAHLEERVLEKIGYLSQRVYHTLQCRDFARIDFRINSRGLPYFIEINPLPGLGTYSDLVIMAVKMGMTHEELIGAVLDTALERYPQYACV